MVKSLCYSDLQDQTVQEVTLIIHMLNDVTPEAYDLKGQSGWAEGVQWEKNRVYNLDSYLADLFVQNGDAEIVESEDL